MKLRCLWPVVQPRLVRFSSFIGRLLDLEKLHHGVKPTKQLEHTSYRGDASSKFCRPLEDLANHARFDLRTRQADVSEENEGQTCDPCNKSADPEKRVEGPDNGRAMLPFIYATSPLDEVEHLARLDHVLIQPEEVHNHVEVASSASNHWRGTPLENGRTSSRIKNLGHLIKHAVEFGSGLACILRLTWPVQQTAKLCPADIPGKFVAKLIEERNPTIVLNEGDATIIGHLNSLANVRVDAPAVASPNTKKDVVAGCISRLVRLVVGLTRLWNRIECLGDSALLRLGIGERWMTWGTHDDSYVGHMNVEVRLTPDLGQ